MSRPVFRYLRMAVLLTILAVVGGQQLLLGNRLNDWDGPLWMTIYPVLADTDAGTRRYQDGLGAQSFEDIASFLAQQAGRYGLDLETPLIIQLADPITTLPPALPEGNAGLSVALWSLKMRWWSWRNGRQDGLTRGDIRMFVVYRKERSGQIPERSVGIRNAAYGLVNAVASRSMSAHNRIVIAHELLHVLGASDKYDPATGQPLVPDGLADPAQKPLYPQARAEIMGARIATSHNRWRRPASLKACVVGAATAKEIGWLRDS